MDRLTLFSKLSRSTFWNKVRLVDTVDSTSDFIRKIDKPCSGTVVIAKQQLNGRGRRGNRWYSPRGGIWLSLLVDILPQELRNSLSILTAWSVIISIQHLGVKANFKPPNDVLIGEKKLAGVLLETYQNWCIVGVGINANNNLDTLPDDVARKSVSLQEITDREVNLGTITGNFLTNFEWNYTNFILNSDVISEDELIVHLEEQTI